MQPMYGYSRIEKGLIRVSCSTEERRGIFQISISSELSFVFLSFLPRFCALLFPIRLVRSRVGTYQLRTRRLRGGEGRRNQVDHCCSTRSPLLSAATASPDREMYVIHFSAMPCHVPTNAPNPNPKPKPVDMVINASRVGSEFLSFFLRSFLAFPFLFLEVDWRYDTILLTVHFFDGFFSSASSM